MGGEQCRSELEQKPDGPGPGPLVDRRLERGREVGL